MAELLTKGLSELAVWAGDILRREVNMTLIQLLLASEELNRLTVDKGLKAGDLSVRMVMRSFGQLDARRRAKTERRLDNALEDLAHRSARQELKLSAKFQRYGKRRLELMQLSPSWPQGLEVRVPERAWPALLSYYGDGPVFELIARIAEKHQALGGGPRSVEIDFDSHGLSGTEIRMGRKADVRFVLKKVEDEEDASWRLRGLERHLDEKS